MHGMMHIGKVLAVAGVILGFSALGGKAEAQSGWEVKSAMTSARCNFGSIGYNGKVYVLGGRDGTGLLDLVQSFNPSTNVWTSLSPLPAAHEGVKPVVLGSRIYAFCGTSVYEYDPAMDTWKTKTKTGPANIIGAVTLNGTIYAIGAGAWASGYLYVYNPTSNSWTTKASMRQGRNQLSVAAVNGKIYAVGGNLVTGGVYYEYKDCEMYNPANNTWTKVSVTNTPRSSFGLVTANGKLYALGGTNIIGASDYTNPSTTSSIEEYDPITNQWKPFGYMRTKRQQFGCAVVNGKISIIGGVQNPNTSPSFLTVNELFTPTAPFHGVYKIIARHSGKTLVVENGATVDNAKILQRSYSADLTTDDEWQISAVGFGLYKMINVKSKKGMTVINGSTANGAPIVQYTYNTTNKNQWYIQDVGNGYFKIVNLKSKKVLEVSGASTANGAAVIQNGYTAKTNQQFKLQRLDNGIITGSAIAYKIVNRKSSLVLNVSGGSTTEGAQLVQSLFSGVQNQYWRPIYIGGGNFKIKNVKSGKLADIESAASYDDSPCVQWTDNGSASQRWSMIGVGGGYFKIKNKNSGKVMTIFGGSTAAGAKAVQFTDNGSASQNWMLVSTL